MQQCLGDVIQQQQGNPAMRHILGQREPPSFHHLHRHAFQRFHLRDGSRTKMPAAGGCTAAGISAQAQDAGLNR